MYLKFTKKLVMKYIGTEIYKIIDEKMFSINQFLVFNNSGPHKTWHRPYITHLR